MDDAVIHHSADQLKQESQLSQWYGIRRRANRNRTFKIAQFFYKIMIVEYEIRIRYAGESQVATIIQVRFQWLATLRRQLLNIHAGKCLGLLTIKLLENY